MLNGPTLTAPFKAAQQINKGGRSLTYIPTSEVIDRLNAVLGVGGWSFEVDVQPTFDSGVFVVVKGRLRLVDPPTVIEQFGGQKINKSKEGETIDLGDDFKGAASDALKKCAQHIGVGLYLALGHPPISGSPSAGDGAEEPPKGDQHGSISSAPTSQGAV